MDLNGFRRSQSFATVIWLVWASYEVSCRIAKSRIDGKGSVGRRYGGGGIQNVVAAPLVSLLCGLFKFGVPLCLLPVGTLCLVVHCGKPD